MPDINIKEIFLTSGVSEEGNGFITLAVHGKDGEILLAQLPPDEARLQALAFLEAAEAADQDAAVLRTTRKLGIQDELAALIVTELRNTRLTMKDDG